MRVRVKELAQEAKYIRFEETKIKSKQKIGTPCFCWDKPTVSIYDLDQGSQDFWKLRNHRTHDVRDAARAIQLAYGFMRDVPYRRIEQTTKPKDPYRWNRIVKEVKRLANKFSNSEKKFDEDVDIWFASDRIDEQKG
tara:strand:- start:31272 stop:31682 length:411 start_codon:yes stop_codon:yes gene_type:complete